MIKVICSREHGGLGIYGGIATHVDNTLKNDSCTILIGNKNADQSYKDNLNNINHIFTFSELFKSNKSVNKFFNLFLLLARRLSLFHHFVRIGFVKKEKIIWEFSDYMFESIFIIAFRKFIYKSKKHIVTVRFHGTTNYDRFADKLTNRNLSLFKKIISNLEFFCIDNCDQILFPSSFSLRIFKKYRPNTKNTKIKMNAINHSFSNKNFNFKNLVFLGDSSVEKGGLRCINYYKYLKNKNYDIKLLMYGRGTIEDIELSIKPRDEIEDLYCSGDCVFFVPSVSETFGYTFYEAHLSSSLVISSNLDVFKEHYDKKIGNCFFVDDWDEIDYKHIDKFIYSWEGKKIG